MSDETAPSVGSAFRRTVTKKVLVTGARGQLAGAIVEAFARDAEVRAYSHEELDIADMRAVSDRVAADKPDVIINCASFN